MKVDVEERQITFETRRRPGRMLLDCHCSRRRSPPAYTERERESCVREALGFLELKNDINRRIETEMSSRHMYLSIPI